MVELNGYTYTSHKVVGRTIKNNLKPVEHLTQMYSLFRKVNKNEYIRVRSQALPLKTAWRVWIDYTLSGHAIRPVGDFNKAQGFNFWRIGDEQ